MSERLVKALEEIHAIEAPYPDCGHLDSARARGIAADALADHRAQAGAMPELPEPECERCGMAPAAHDYTHWCDNQSFRCADGSTQLGASTAQPSAVPDAGTRKAISESVAFSDVFAPIFEALSGSAATDLVKDAARLAAACAFDKWQAGRQQGMEQARAMRELLAIRVAGASLYTDDGELSDCSVHPAIDFLRDTPEQIKAKLIERGGVQSTSPADSAVASGVLGQARAESTGQAVAWCALTPGGQIAYFDGRPMIMTGSVGNDLHPVPLVARASEGS